MQSPEHVLIAGLSTRAFALSAARAGYRVTAVDAFGDLDLRGTVEVVPLRRQDGSRFTARAAAAAAQKIKAGRAAYTSNFENYPAAVTSLAQHHQLMGNPAAVLTRVRDPMELTRVLQRRGFATPRTRLSIPSAGSWLLKPRRSGGGHGTAAWRRGQPVPRTHYLQERIAGTPGSVVFAADGRRAAPLGITRQLVGDARFGAHGFRYCGSLLASSVALFPNQSELVATASLLAQAAAEEFGLVGLNGIDFIARDGVPYPIEVNPRYSASMELVERAAGVSMFQVHARACRGILPPALSLPDAVEGKAIVFARRAITVGDARRWLGPDWLADVPHPGELIRRGHPICTVFARASDPAGCLRQLTRRAATVYRAAGSRKRGAA